MKRIENYKNKDLNYVLIYDNIETQKSIECIETRRIRYENK